MRKRVAEMTAEEILGDRKWPAWFTTQQAREQMEHEGKGCPPPWPEAVARRGLSIATGCRYRCLTGLRCSTGLDPNAKVGFTQLATI